MPITLGEKKPVAARALLARLNRALAKRDEQLMRCSVRSQWFKDLGSYYLVSHLENSVVARCCSLEKLAREHGVLAPHETLIECD